MLIVTAFVNYNQIDEIWIHNTGEKKNGLTKYEIEKPKGDYPFVWHKRSDGWMKLTSKVMKILEKGEKYVK